jgi:hypothetical protein
LKFKTFGFFALALQPKGVFQRAGLKLPPKEVFRFLPSLRFSPKGREGKGQFFKGCFKTTLGFKPTEGRER